MLSIYIKQTRANKYRLIECFTFSDISLIGIFVLQLFSALVPVVPEVDRSHVDLLLIVRPFCLACTLSVEHVLRQRQSCGLPRVTVRFFLSPFPLPIETLRSSRSSYFDGLSPQCAVRGPLLALLQRGRFLLASDAPDRRVVAKEQRRSARSDSGG